MFVIFYDFFLRFSHYVGSQQCWKIFIIHDLLLFLFTISGGFSNFFGGLIFENFCDINKFCNILFIFIFYFFAHNLISGIYQDHRIQVPFYFTPEYIDFAPRG